MLVSILRSYEYSNEALRMGTWCCLHCLKKKKKKFLNFDHCKNLVFPLPPRLCHLCGVLLWISQQWSIPISRNSHQWTRCSGLPWLKQNHKVLITEWWEKMVFGSFHPWSFRELINLLLKAVTTPLSSAPSIMSLNRPYVVSGLWYAALFLIY